MFVGLVPVEANTTGQGVISRLGAFPLGLLGTIPGGYECTAGDATFPAIANVPTDRSPEYKVEPVAIEDTPPVGGNILVGVLILYEGPVSRIGNMCNAEPGPLPVAIGATIVGVSPQCSHFPSSFLGGQSLRLVRTAILLEFVELTGGTATAVPVSELNYPDKGDMGLASPSTIPYVT